MRAGYASTADSATDPAAEATRIVLVTDPLLSENPPLATRCAPYPPSTTSLRLGSETVDSDRHTAEQRRLSVADRSAVRTPRPPCSNARRPKTIMVPTEWAP